jgi:hypothetical protein
VKGWLPRVIGELAVAAGRLYFHVSDDGEHLELLRVQAPKTVATRPPREQGISGGRPPLRATRPRRAPG